MDEALAVIPSHTFTQNDRESDMHPVDIPCTFSCITASFNLSFMCNLRVLAGLASLFLWLNKVKHLQWRFTLMMYFKCTSTLLV